MAIETFTAATTSSSTPYDLSAYSIPFAYSWPTAPTITSTHFVNNSSELALANVNGARITLNAGDYGDVSPANDQEWILTANATINAFNYTGSSRVKIRGENPRDGRIGYIVGPPEFSGQTAYDILFDGIYQSSGSWTVSAGQASNAPVGRRIAIVNSDLNTASYCLFMPFHPADDYGDIIIAGNHINSDDRATTWVGDHQHLCRFMSTHDYIMVGNYMEKNTQGQLIRLHTLGEGLDHYNGFIGDNVVVTSTFTNFMALQFAPSSGNAVVDDLRDVTVDGNEIYCLNNDSIIAWQDEAATASRIYSNIITNNVGYGGGNWENGFSNIGAQTLSNNTSQAYSGAVTVPTATQKLGWTPA